MIYCSHCGKELPVDSKFCPSCGTTVPTVENKSDEPIRTEPVRTERIVTEPVKTERVVLQPVRKETMVTEPVVTNIYKGSSGTHKKIEFFLNPGFWGSVLVLIGFFLPIINTGDAKFFNSGISLFDIVKTTAESNAAVYLYVVFPVSALIILIQSLTHALPSFIVVIFKIIALLVLALFAYVIFKSPGDFNIPANDVKSLFTTIGLGIYATVIGTILMLFNTKYRRVERRIDRVDRVDERL